MNPWANTSSYCFVIGSGGGNGGGVALLSEASSSGPAYLSGRGALTRGSLCSSRTTKSASKQSLLDLVGNRLGVAGGLSLGVSQVLSSKFSKDQYFPSHFHEVALYIA